LLLDEPASGLDAAETIRFAELLLRVRDIFRLTMLLVEHDMQLVLGVADYLYVLNFGKLLAQGEPTAVVNDPAVVAAYLGGDADGSAEDAPPATVPMPRQDTHRSAGVMGGGWQR
jgi:branched-chain amino acid transport system ATP-binding protein